MPFNIPFIPINPTGPTNPIGPARTGPGITRLVGPTPGIQHYEIVFSSNFNSEVENALSLEYFVRDNTAGLPAIQTDIIPLTVGSTDNKSIADNLINSVHIDFTIKGQLPVGFAYKKLYWALPVISNNNSNTQPDFTKWNEVIINPNGIVSATVPGSALSAGGFAVVIILEKIKEGVTPTVTIPPSLTGEYKYAVRESDVDKEITITFTTTDTDYVDVYTAANTIIRVYQNNTANTGSLGQNVVDVQSGNSVTLSFNTHFSHLFGSKLLVFVPTRGDYGTGIQQELIIEFAEENDFPSITNIVFPIQIDVPSFSGFDITYDVIYQSVHVTSVDVFLLDKQNTKIKIFSDIAASGTISINTRELAQTYSAWNGSETVTLIFIPYNRGGEEN